MANPLLPYCEENDIELLAVQLPGRGGRRQEKRLTSAQQIASAVFKALVDTGRLTSTALSQVPYLTVSHSMGGLCAYELIKLIQRTSTHPLPLHCFICAMAAPHIPRDLRPWRVSSHLSEVELKEECRMWDVNNEVFGKGVWEVYEPLLRDDFKVFDEYEFEGDESGDRGGTDSTGERGESGERSERGEADESSEVSSLSSASAVILSPDIPTSCYVCGSDKRVTHSIMSGWAEVMCGVDVKPQLSQLSEVRQSPSVKEKAKVKKLVDVVNKGGVSFKMIEIVDATHSVMYDNDGRRELMSEVMSEVDGVLLDLEYG
eukprot:GHVN01061461.1.p1 GENE.GHVN01061461.1~~GHVN01061461.1.p1  ORF type:complete len:317 (-),score=102.89 GHVN01061461.1:415-1365(-)